MSKNQNFFSPYVKVTNSEESASKSSALKTQLSQLPNLFPLLGVLFMLVLPAVFVTFFTPGANSITFSIKEILIAGFFFLVPVILFYRNIKLYFYLLLPMILLSPVFIFAVLVFDLRPRLELMAVVLQTNLGEMKEAVSGYLGLLIPLVLAYSLLYLYCVRKISFEKIPFKVAFSISFLAVLFTFGKIILEKDLHEQPLSELNAESIFVVRYYPASLVGGALEANAMIGNKMKVPEDFSFHAFAKDTVSERKIFVFIIGESSRYDRWQLHGYHRPTSPRLLKHKDLISYPNVVAGSNQTRISVPIMITRASPDSVDIILREKSVMTAFKEAGYKTAWLSNQTDQELFYSGAINWHAKTADISQFSPSISPNFEFDSPYDERLLPVLDSLISNTNENLFIILHTMGNHWDYSKRYPKTFDVFKPSGKIVPIVKPAEENRQAVINSYDNSILYGDFIIDSVINTVKKHKAISAITYQSDHGEDLYDADPERIDFHLGESPNTLHVPLFIWTSELYKEHYPAKQQALLSNLNKKAGGESTFHTLLDMANIGILKADSTKSLASPGFQDSKQMYIGNKVKDPLYYSNLIK